MREARVRQNGQLKVITAHTGREYVKSEWRVVPDDGSVSSLLEYRNPDEEPDLEPDAVLAIVPEPVKTTRKRAPRKRTPAKGK